MPIEAAERKSALIVSNIMNLHESDLTRFVARGLKDLDVTDHPPDCG